LRAEFKHRRVLTVEVRRVQWCTRTCDPRRGSGLLMCMSHMLYKLSDVYGVANTQYGVAHVREFMSSLLFGVAESELDGWCVSLECDNNCALS